MTNQYLIDVSDLHKSFGDLHVLNGVSEHGSKGEVVSIMDENNVEFARGMVNYSSQECRRIVGSHSNNIEKILGYKNYDAVITRDNITGLV